MNTHSNNIGPQAPEEAGQARIEELQDAAANPADVLNYDMLVEAISDFHCTLNGESKTINALIDAVAAAKEMDNTGCARTVLRWFDLLLAHARWQAEDARKTEIDRQWTADEVQA